MSEDVRKTIETIERQAADIEEMFIGGLIRESMSEEEWDALTDEEYTEIFNRILLSRHLIPTISNSKWENFLNHMNGLNK